MPSHFAKKSIPEIDPARLSEPELTQEDRAELAEGIAPFNDRRYWDAHESWEKVWQRRPEESRIFFQGIIQLAAGLHLVVVKHRYQGAMRNFEKAVEKLRLFPATFLGVDVAGLLDATRTATAHLTILGVDRLHEFDPALLPFINARLPMQ